jgi:hypothetical protein
MKELTEEQKAQRVDDYVEEYIAAHSKWGDHAQFGYFAFNGLAIACTAAVPIVGFLPTLHIVQATDSVATSAIAGIFGALAGAFRGLDSFLKTRDTWLRNWIQAEKLSIERELFMAGAPPYNKPRPQQIQLYAERATSLRGQELAAWLHSEVKRTDGRPPRGS